MIFITVYYGTLLLTVDGEQYRLTRGDSLRFRADQPYELYNRDIQVCECQVTVNAPRGAALPVFKIHRRLRRKAHSSSLHRFASSVLMLQWNTWPSGSRDASP